MPPDLVLAVIQNESGGIPGAPGRGRTRCGMVPTLDGGQVEICRAFGLMQTIPATVDGYNKRQTDPDRIATIEDISGTDERAARLQIAIGCHYLAGVNHYLNQNYPQAAPAASLAEAGGDQVRFVLAGYAVGHGAIGEKLAALAAAGRPMTFAALKSTFPNWGQNAAGEWINRPLYYAERVGNKYQNNRSNSYTGGRAGALAARVKERIGGGGFALLAAAGLWAGWKFYERRRHENT